jgi:cell division protein FtsA
MRKIYSSIDIGSSFIKIVVVEELEKKLNVLANISYPSKGIKEGMIVDMKSAVISLKEALEEINKSLGVKIDKAITSVPSEQARYTITEGYTTITSEEKIVTSEDILNSLQASIYNQIDEKEELVTVMPIKYIVDDRAEVKNPRGIHANKLGVLSMMITAPKQNIYKQVSLLSNAGVEVVDILFNSIGDYYALKEDSFDKENAAVINIGTDKTEVSVFTNGILRSSNLVYMGSNELEEDLAYAYNISLEKASNLKDMFITFDRNSASDKEIYETKDKANIKVKINQYEASEIASNKLKEILEKAKKEINYLTKKEIRYIIITGGIVNIPGFYEIAKDVFGDIVSDKEFDVIGIRNYVYTSSYGMIKYFIEKLKLRGREYTMFNEDKEYKLVEERKNNKGFSFSKFFGYFFEKEE